MYSEVHYLEIVVNMNLSNGMAVSQNPGQFLIWSIQYVSAPLMGLLK